jgi:hypothetical protein
LDGCYGGGVGVFLTVFLVERLCSLGHRVRHAVECPEIGRTENSVENV